MLWKNTTIYFALLVLTAFLVISLFGLSHTAGMKANDSGNMEGCIFTGKTMLCQMGVVEHISLWQGMFTAIHHEASIFAILLVLLAVALSIAIHYSPRPRDTEHSGGARLYLHRHPDIPLFDPLRQAFSRGIIHPKIYELATL